MKRLARCGHGSMIRGVVVALALQAGLSSAARATTYILVEDAALIAAADVAVLARVRSAVSVEDYGGISTRIQLDVEEVLRGRIGPEPTVRLPGGAMGGRRRVVFGMPLLRPGSRYLLLLERRTDDT